NHLDPTQLYYAAAAWIAAAAMPDTQPHLAERDWGWEARWKGADGHAYIAWWRPDDNVNEIGRAPLKLPETSLVFDPLHCQILKLPAREAPPLCAWPLVARLP
ncbi:MAG: hypothetical protein H5T86_03290, partial [Armatimonadetes bacterium]|nr:hypothetical protein [Armatimonadota bacterium]